jgi:CRISPR-associated protein (TIGR03984 family)
MTNTKTVSCLSDLACQPLTAQQTKSRTASEPMPHSLEELTGQLAAHHIQDATIIAWQIHQVSWARFQDGRLDDHPSPIVWPLLTELRAFNPDFELHLYQEDGLITGRWRFDGEGDSIEYVDSGARLWGERLEAPQVEIPEGFIILRDASRKISQTIPAPVIRSSTYGLITRSYLGTTDSDVPQASYIDHRFVAIVPDRTERNDA